MNEKFSYLKKYMSSNFLNAPEGYQYSGEEGYYGNIFYESPASEIKEAEKKMGISFPTELNRFYREIGYGLLRAVGDPPAGYIFNGTNEILPPLVAAIFYKPLGGDHRPEDEFAPLDAGDGEHYMSASAYETMEPGDLPFFEIGDGTSFMVMKPHSENPNAVWLDCELKIEDSFERFIWRLYYEDPAYYGDIIEAHYQNSHAKTP